MSDIASQANAASETMVDIGGYRLRLGCAGQGTPTVVIEAGLGEGLNEWAALLPHVAAFTRMRLPMAIDGGTHFLGDVTGPTFGLGFRDTNAWLVALTDNALPPTGSALSALATPSARSARRCG